MDDQAKRELTSHIREHVSYPTSKKAIVEACSNMAHVPDTARQLVTSQLADKQYNSADQVLKALGL